MTAPADLDALIARVEGLTAPDRDANVSILSALFGGVMMPYDDTMKVLVGVDSEIIPITNLTGSVDDALAFAKRLGFDGHQTCHDALELLSSGGWRPNQSFAPQLARAIIVIALKALIAEAEVAHG